MELTDDLAQATADLDEYGYCLLTCPIPEDELHAVQKRLAEVMQQERDDGTAFLYENDNQRVFSLLNKGTEFADLVANGAVFRVMEHLLGYNFMLSSTHANVAGPGGASMNLHADQTFARPPWPPYALVANSMWMLDEFTDANGATRIVPGSHRWNRQPDYLSGEGNTETVPVCGPAGSVMVFDGRLWHQTGQNTTGGEYRRGILNYYCRGYIRQQQNFFVGLDQAVLDRATPRMRRLLGWENYLSLGMLDGLP
ncbi:MAG TPA: phytanoyl-CoA dioxygenase family protein [Actinophytocola sp.]|uniref:phytanoyl-CoA dioxygenase family protein n=1 Tax=Actinophytocola sp. TaxID=1872138 RepID=UPI002DC047D1|nr:phytanoyl-CoA dioxygenase family protein [Actinophytocola sp.]HEU5473566.1 phytanoyl-CoA dioxygenase family protein [Actinophytocola sp.]